MHGNPLHRILLVIVVFLGIGFITVRQTRSGEAAPAPGGDAPSPEREGPRAVTLHLSARALPAPERLEVTCLGQTVLAGGGEAGRFQSDWTTSVPAGGVDLVVAARWPSPTPMAATELTVAFPDGRTVSKTFWSDGSAAGGLRDVLTVGAEAPRPDGSE